MKLQIKPTEDGSTTIYNSELDENYHSVFGAIQEAKHIYLNAGFENLAKHQNKILEIGFGTGLNALLTCQKANEQKKEIIYHSIEKYPLKEELISQLSFGEENKELLAKVHAAKWNSPVKITPYFTLLKIHADLLSFDFSENYDLIYYDAFAPSKQQEVWKPNILQKVANTLNKGGILTTYSTKGTVKQGFRAAGLFVKRLKGPIGKRDMLWCKKEE